MTLFHIQFLNKKNENKKKKKNPENKSNVYKYMGDRMWLLAVWIYMCGWWLGMWHIYFFLVFVVEFIPELVSSLDVNKNLKIYSHPTL